MTAYVKWIGRRNELMEDKERGYPTAYLGRSMATHGEDFEQDSEFGNCLLSLGRANERIAAIQESYVETATATWLDNLERSLAMMKEYQVCQSIRRPRSFANMIIGISQEARKPTTCLRC